MSETVTLTLPDEVTQRARATAENTGRRFEDVLTDWLQRGATDDQTRFLSNKAFDVWSPQDTGNDVFKLQAMLDEEQRRNAR